MQCFPQEIGSTTAVAPTISFSHLWYWGEFNGVDVGLRLLELQYVVTPNDATDISVDARIFSTAQSQSFSWTGVTGTGTVSLRESTAGIPFYHSFDDPATQSWQVELTMHYELGGASHTETLNVSPGDVKIRAFKPETTVTFGSDGITIAFGSESADPFTYSIPGIDEISLSWYREEADYWVYLGETTLYSGGEGLTVLTPGTRFHYACDPSKITPPDGAEEFTISIKTAPDWTGTSSFTSITVSKPWYAYQSMRPVSDLTS